MINWNGLPPLSPPPPPWLTAAGAGAGAGAGAATGISTPASRYPFAVVIMSQAAFFSAPFDLLHSSYSGVPRSAAVNFLAFIAVPLRNCGCICWPETNASSSGRLFPSRVIAKTVMAKPTQRHGKSGSLRPIFGVRTRVTNQKKCRWSYFTPISSPNGLCQAERRKSCCSILFHHKASHGWLMYDKSTPHVLKSASTWKTGQPTQCSVLLQLNITAVLPMETATENKFDDVL